MACPDVQMEVILCDEWSEVDAASMKGSQAMNVVNTTFKTTYGSRYVSNKHKPATLEVISPIHEDLEKNKRRKTGEVNVHEYYCICELMKTFEPSQLKLCKGNCSGNVRLDEIPLPD